MLLAIDTSTADAGIACYDGERGALGECVWRAGRDHTAQLLPQIDLLLRHIRCARSDIRAVAVALGPGSWSGLRVGMSVAKGFALARDLPLIGIGTLQAVAYQHRVAHLRVVPVINLGRGRVAALANDAQEPQNLTIADLAATINEPALFCGDVDAEFQAMLRRLLPNRAHFPSPAANVRRPAYLAELAWKRLIAGECDRVATLEPIYLGQPVKTVG
ncbi:tRNA (adenosine(37)-N6)-threonylcarbamoyltransferase complex dimerization subunit type 1 TsaB [Roseiflexus castenholzii]|jgi:tRNA threonylcarbamoyladenosine biosynthesis protein TsaB|uniref:Peptidase M22 glycoprotease n=1 Tax=Roseiflexus castenholzii (strain DSM 13941 / HLO8) TaxID=383372 RepID=A7NH88_ROSCS|nr:tRNA (adenosine(37)-N6)-threonylcarbamoyltransferase complex dimerization subunit type 1 TsaB [Roseiflexus castenholzii]ABU56835.1 peptidase M22 glycoprotease [Roseiflexus castenholzii DSM 13941]